MTVVVRSDTAGYPHAGMGLAKDDARVTEPLYTISEAALFLGQRPSTLRDWVRGRGSKPIVTSVEDNRGEPIIPFIGFAEGAIAALFKSVKGVSTQYIRKVLRKLQEEMRVEHALASKRLYMYGAKMLFDYVQEDATTRLIEVVSQNAVFRPVVQEKLERITYGEDGWVARLILPSTPREIVLVDPFRAAGQPLTVAGGARIVDLLERFRGGEPPSFIAEDYGVPERDVIDILRAFYKATPEAA